MICRIYAIFFHSHHFLKYGHVLLRYIDYIKNFKEFCDKTLHINHIVLSIGIIHRYFRYVPILKSFKRASKLKHRLSMKLLQSHKTYLIRQLRLSLSARYILMSHTYDERAYVPLKEYEIKEHQVHQQSLEILHLPHEENDFS